MNTLSFAGAPIERGDSRDRSGWFAAALLLTALIFGGGGSPAPAAELALELIAAALLGLFLVGKSASGDLRRVPLQAWIVAALVLGFAVLQLVPLPPLVWQALPGRGIERDLLALAGADDTWRPWSMTGDRTLAGLLSLVPPLAVLLLVAGASRRGAGLTVAALAAGGLLTVVVGTGQVAGGASSPLRFYGTDVTYLLGFQANHNSTADVLLIAIPACAAAIVCWARDRREPPPRGYVLGLFGGAATLLLLAIVLAGSRAGIALSPLALGFSLWTLRDRIRFDRRSGAAVLGLALIVGGAAWGLRNNSVLEARIARFSQTEEARPDLWRDTLFAARRHWPVGAGIGSFVPIYVATERLEIVGERMPNRAHNDFLEFLLEGGLPGLLMLAAVAALLARRIVALGRARAFARDPARIVGLATLSVVVAHSLVDYPLRSMALAAATAAAAGVLLRGDEGDEAAPPISEKGGQ